MDQWTRNINTEGFRENSSWAIWFQQRHSGCWINSLKLPWEPHWCCLSEDGLLLELFLPSNLWSSGLFSIPCPLIWTCPKCYTATPGKVQHHSQSPIKAESHPVHCFALLWGQTPISAMTHVRETVHLAKCLNPSIVVLLLCLPRDTGTLSVRRIYLSVQKLPLLNCVNSLEDFNSGKCLSTQERWVPVEGAFFPKIVTTLIDLHSQTYIYQDIPIMWDGKVTFLQKNLLSLLNGENRLCSTRANASPAGSWNSAATATTFRTEVLWTGSTLSVWKAVPSSVSTILTSRASSTFWSMESTLNSSAGMLIMITWAHADQSRWWVYVCVWRRPLGQRNIQLVK